MISRIHKDPSRSKWLWYTNNVHFTCGGRNKQRSFLWLLKWSHATIWTLRCLNGSVIQNKNSLLLGYAKSNQSMGIFQPCHPSISSFMFGIVLVLPTLLMFVPCSGGVPCSFLFFITRHPLLMIYYRCKEVMWNRAHRRVEFTTWARKT